MKYTQLLNEHRNLEKQVLESLKKEIEASEIKSGHMNTKCLKVGFKHFIEIVCIDDEIMFIDTCGIPYNLWEYSSLYDLIDLLTQIEE